MDTLYRSRPSSRAASVQTKRPLTARGLLGLWRAFFVRGAGCAQTSWNVALMRRCVLRTVCLSGLNAASARYKIMRVGRCVAGA
jgi:hypothetical protein